MKHLKSLRSGFTLLYAVLVMGVLLGIIFAIYSISYKQVALSGVAKDSQLAFYMADSGAECVKYWDYRGAFSTSTPANIICNGTTYTVGGHATTDTCPTGSGTCAINSLTLKYAGASSNAGHPPEAVITLYKNMDTGESTLLSYGHNTDDKTSNRRLERAIKLVYTPPLSPFCPINGDIMVMVDISGSVTSIDDQTNIAQGVRDLINGLYRSPSQIKIGLITFGDYPFMPTWAGLQTKDNENYLLCGSLGCDPNNKSAAADGSVENMYVPGNAGRGTNLSAALRLAQYEFTEYVATDQRHNIFASSTQTVCADGTSNCQDNRKPDGALNTDNSFPNIAIIITDGAPHGTVNTNGTYNGGTSNDAGSAANLTQAEAFADSLKSQGFAHIAALYVDHTGDTAKCGTDNNGNNFHNNCIEFLKRAIVGKPSDTGVATDTSRSTGYMYSVNNTADLSKLVNNLTNCNSGS